MILERQEAFDLASPHGSDGEYHKVVFATRDLGSVNIAQYAYAEICSYTFISGIFFFFSSESYWCVFRADAEVSSYFICIMWPVCKPGMGVHSLILGECSRANSHNTFWTV